MLCYSRVVNFGFDEAKMRNCLSSTPLMMLLMMFSQRSRGPSTDWGLFLKFQNSTSVGGKDEEEGKIEIMILKMELVLGFAHLCVQKPLEEIEKSELFAFLGSLQIWQIFHESECAEISIVHSLCR